MRYCEDHKARTRQRILEQAALQFRRDGVGATGLQPLMKALGLTHGGFYAHFGSKGELVESALRHAVEELQRSNAHEQLPQFIRSYLSSAHRANPGEGCPLPTMSAELGQRGEASETTDELVRDRLTLIERNLGGEDAAEQSVLMLSALVGALLLSRSVTDPQLSDRLLKTTRAQLLEHVSAQDREPGTPAP